MRPELIEARDAGRFKFVPVVQSKKSTPAKAVASTSAPAHAVVSPNVPTSSPSVVPVRPASPPKVFKASTPTELESQPSEGMSPELGSFESEWGDVFSEEFVRGDVLEGPYAMNFGLKERTIPVVKKEDAGRFEEVDELAESEESEGGEEVVVKGVEEKIVQGGGESVVKRKAESFEESLPSSSSKRMKTTEEAVLPKTSLPRPEGGARAEAMSKVRMHLDTALADLGRLNLAFPESEAYVSLLARGLSRVIEELRRM